MIRKSGWLIFLVLVSIVLALVYLFAGPAIRFGMVYSLERAVGAEVNIARVSLSLAPLALNIRDLQITDKERPTHNTLSFEQANASLEVWPALLGYYVIDDLSIDGLAYGRERSSPGEVYRREKTEQESVDIVEVLQLDFPDADELMARANLQTEAQGAALREQASTQQQRLEALESELPNRERLNQIEAEIAELTESPVESPADLATKTEQLRRLQDTLRTERDKVRQVQEQLGQSREQLQQAVADLREANASDWQTLRQLANVGEGGLAPISQILLGDVWGERIAQFESVYRLVAPYLPESLGRGESEPERTLPNRILPLPGQPYPDYWIKNARVNWLIGGGEATVSMQDITGQHELINAATRFNLDAQNLPRVAAFAINGDFQVLDQMVTNLAWQVDGYTLEEMALGRGSSALKMASGTVNSTGTLRLVDRQVEQEAEVVLQQANFGTEGHRYMQQLADLLNQQDQIPLSLGATGSVSSPNVSVRSPLDSLIGDALMGEAREKVAQLEADLRAQLDSQLEQQLGEQTDWRSTLEQRETQVEDLQARIDEMLAARLDGVRDDARDRVREGLRDRVRGG